MPEEEELLPPSIEIPSKFLHDARVQNTNLRPPVEQPQSTRRKSRHSSPKKRKGIMSNITAKDKGKNIVDDDFVEDVSDDDIRKKLKIQSVVGLTNYQCLKKGCTFYVSPNQVLRKDSHWAATTVDIAKDLKEKLTDVQLNMFRRTCFGYFLDLPKAHVQKQLIRQLMLREIESDMPNTFTIMLNGTRLNFGIREFATITGLKCVMDDTFVNSAAPNRLMKSYFPNQDEKVLKSSLVNCFNTKSWIGDEDAVKIAILYFISCFVLFTHDGKNAYIPKAHFDLVDSGAYDNYHWGKDSFKMLLASVSQKLHKDLTYYRLCGCPLALQIWFYECCSQVDDDIAGRVSNTLPRILNWEVLNSSPRTDSLTKGMFHKSGHQLLICNISPTCDELANLKLPALHEIDSQKDFDHDAMDIDHLEKGGDQDYQSNLPKVVVHQGKPTADQPVLKIDTEKEIQKLRQELDQFRTTVNEQFDSLKDYMEKSFKKVFDELQLLVNSKGVINILDDDKQSSRQTENSDQNPHKHIRLDQINETINDVPLGNMNVPIVVNTKNCLSTGEKSGVARRSEFPSFDLGFSTQKDEEHGSTVLTAANVSAGIVDESGKVNVKVADLCATEATNNDDTELDLLVRSNILKIDESVNEYMIRMRQRKENARSGDEPVEETDKRCENTHPNTSEPEIVIVDGNDSPVLRHRQKWPGKHQKSPFLTKFSCGSSSNTAAPPRFQLKHPFTSAIGALLDQDLQDEFLAWVREGLSARPKSNNPYLKKFVFVGPFNFGVEVIEKKDWFYQLVQGTCPLSDTHIDIIFYYLRKKAKYVSGRPRRFTTTDCLFKTKVEEVYTLYLLRKRDINVLLEGEDVANYICGYRLLANVPWTNVDYVLLPINIEDKCHWVLGVLSFKHRCIWVYDSNWKRGSLNTAVVDTIRSFSVILPMYLRITGFYGERPDIDLKRNTAYKDISMDSPYKIVLMKNVPQQKSGSLDCGLFMAAYAEYFSDGYIVPPGDFDVDIYRKRLGALLWDYGRKKYDLKVSSDTEDAGKAYTRKGGPKGKKHIVV